jgi:hypothetical protein
MQDAVNRWHRPHLPCQAVARRRAGRRRATSRDLAEHLYSIVVSQRAPLCSYRIVCASAGRGHVLAGVYRRRRARRSNSGGHCRAAPPPVGSLSSCSSISPARSSREPLKCALRRSPAVRERPVNILTRSLPRWQLTWHCPTSQPERLDTPSVSKVFVLN